MLRVLAFAQCAGSWFLLIVQGPGSCSLLRFQVPAHCSGSRFLLSTQGPGSCSVLRVQVPAQYSGSRFLLNAPGLSSCSTCSVLVLAQCSGSRFLLNDLGPGSYSVYTQGTGPCSMLRVQIMQNVCIEYRLLCIVFCSNYKSVFRSIFHERSSNK